MLKSPVLEFLFWLGIFFLYLFKLDYATWDLLDDY